MRVSINSLREYIQIKDLEDDFFELLEDVGLEVKSLDNTPEDTVIKFEILANRGDHYSYLGIAREIAARTGAPLPSFLQETKVPQLPSSSTAIHIQTPFCFAYSLSSFVVEKKGSLDIPQNFSRIVQAEGLLTDKFLVDLTNGISLEVGHPVHVFDSTKIQGAITIRETAKGEKAHLLFAEKETELPEGTLVITDDVKILAVAGVIGCENSKVEENTGDILIESAFFDPVKVRKAARALGLGTTASRRFERGADRDAMILVINRIRPFLEKAGWKMKEYSLEESGASFKKTIPCTLSQLNEYLGTNYSLERVLAHLKAYNFDIQQDERTPEHFTITTPPARYWDVEGFQDIAEELCRAEGYNSIPIAYPQRQPAGDQHMAKMLNTKEKIEEFLVHNGFFEIFTNPYYSDQYRSRLGISEDSPLWKHVSILEAEDSNVSMLKNNNMAHALELLKTNMNFQQPNNRAFEWNRTFWPQAGGCEETKVLWGVASGSKDAQTNWHHSHRSYDVFDVKGLLEGIALALNTRFTFRQINNTEEGNYAHLAEFLHPGRRALILQGERVLGILGEIHPQLLSDWKIKNLAPVFFELSQDILDLPAMERHYVEPTNILPNVRDLCFVLPHQFSSEAVNQVILEFSPLVQEVQVVEVYQAPGEQTRAVTYRISFHSEGPNGKAVSAQQTNDTLEAMIGQVEKVFADQKVKLR